MSAYRTGRGTLFRGNEDTVLLLQEDHAPCDSNMAVLCIHLTQPL